MALSKTSRDGDALPGATPALKGTCSLAGQVRLCVSICCRHPQDLLLIALRADIVIFSLFPCEQFLIELNVPLKNRKAATHTRTQSRPHSLCKSKVTVSAGFTFQSKWPGVSWPAANLLASASLAFHLPGQAWEKREMNAYALQGSKNPGAWSHFATGTRGFATRKLGAVATLRLKPEDQAHHCDQMNILRDQIRKTKIRNGFRFQLGRKRATWVSPVACACSWESTENCPRAQRSAGFVVWHLAICG